MEILSTVINKSNLSCYQAIAKGYATGDFSDFIPYLTEETVFESQWVLSHLKGKGEIADYLLGKGETLKNCGLEIKADVVRCNNGVGGVVVIQKRDDGSIQDMFVQLSFDVSGNLARVDLCMRQFFRCHLLKDGEL